MTNAHDAKAMGIVDYEKARKLPLQIRLRDCATSIGMAWAWETPVHRQYVFDTMIEAAAALRDCERQTLERAAKVAELIKGAAYEDANEDAHDCAALIVDRIRALAQEEPGSPDKTAGEPRDGIR